MATSAAIAPLPAMPMSKVLTASWLASIAPITPAAAAGVLGAVLTARLRTGNIDIGMAGNGAIAGLVAITAPSGYVELWAAPIIGVVAGVIVVVGVYAIDKVIDDPVGALSAHGLAGIWGTLSCGLFTAPRLAQYNAFGDPEGGLCIPASSPS